MRDPDETARILYRSILRRDPSPEEIERARTQAEAGQDAADLAAALARSREAERYQVRLFTPPGHFYSPVCDPKTLLDRIPRHRQPVERELPGLDLDIGRMTRFWDEALAPHARATPFPDEPDPRFRYYFRNPAYSYGDAITLRAMILHHRPRRIVEVGSGWSSACTLDTAFGEADWPVDVTFIEPYPQLLEKTMWEADRDRVTVIPTGVQDVDLGVFESLGRNDILFIDSTHVLKTGSDVVHELCEILPRLNEGVPVHFHDIFYPFEYGYKWVIEHNRSWNELYALRCFLSFNDRFEILFFNDMFVQLRRDVLARSCPKFLQNTGGALWIRRIK